MLVKNNENELKEIDDERALKIGRLILEFIDPLVFQVKHVTKKPGDLKLHYTLICEFTGTIRDKNIKEKFDNRRKSLGF